MSDMVERLRARKATWQQAIAVMEEAADEIERLRWVLEQIKELETLDDGKLSTSGEIAKRALTNG